MAKAIHVKYLAATNTKPARYKAYDMDGNQKVTTDGWSNTPCLYTHAAHMFRGALRLGRSLGRWWH